MRKHPLIAVSALTALGASVAAGASTGTFNSVLSSARAPRGTNLVALQHGFSRSAFKAAADMSIIRPGARTQVVLHDPWRPTHIRISGRTGLPVRAARRKPAKPAVHHVVVAAPTPPPTTVAPAPPPTTEAPAPPPPAPVAPAGGVWYELRMCESGGNYAEDSGNGYYGAYQFALSTWYGLGFTGLPSDAPPAVQDQAAQELQARSGWGQWPACSAELGL